MQIDSDSLMYKKTVSMLIVSNSASTADSWINVLRDSGLAVHAERQDNLNNCHDRLAGQHLDLVLYDLQDGNIEFDAFLDCYRSSDSDAHILLLAPEVDSSLLTRHFSDGVRDIIYNQDLPRLVVAVKRELIAHELQHELATVRQQLTESEHRCQTLIESSEEALAYIHDGMHMHINPAYMDLFGYIDEEELASKPILDLIADKYQGEFKKLLRTINNITEDRKIEVQCVNADGVEFHALMTFSPAIYEDEPCVQVMVQNLELQHKVRLVSDMDPQTGLYSRHHFMQELQHYFTQKDTGSGPLYLLYILVDGFQEMKNQHGLVASDLILQEISELLGDNLLPGMTLSRYGDHSFTIVATDQYLTDAEAFARALSAKVQQQAFKTIDGVLNTTLSIGISSSDAPQVENADELLNQAYSACNQIFMHGGNGVKIHAAEPIAELPGSDSTISDEVHLKELISYALEHDKFRLVYQPIVSIQGNTRENYAVMLRLLDNNNEEIRPGIFLPQARQSGQMAQIDRWVVQHAIVELVQQRSKGSRLNFYVQISEEGITDDTLLLWICDCLRDYNAKGAWLTFQFDCSNVHNHMQQAEKLIQGLKKINCNIAINEFGNCTQPEQLLKRLPVDTVKLPAEMMHGISANPPNQQKLRELNKLAQAHEVMTIAPGVEDANTLSTLWSIGVNHIQGFFLQEPSEIINYDFQA
ncbi:MAG: EAL domain-containing protein [Chromatiales bacterium]|jgi:diguanylate cyclase (GGDEF)-like protein/PAS domain S-box-containing protein